MEIIDKTKKIFDEGRKELKRRSALRKETRGLSQKQEAYAQHQRELGQKAWEANLNLDNYGNSSELIANVKQKMDDLQQKVATLEKEKQEKENAKSDENNSYNSQRQELETKKQAVDNRLEEERKIQKDTQREISTADSRLKHIDKEKEQLQTKAAAEDTPEEEKKAIPQKLDALEVEKKDLESKRADNSQKTQAQQVKISPLEGESDGYKKELERIKGQHRELIAQLDDAVSELKKEIAVCNDALVALNLEQNQNFRQLGEKLEKARVSDETVSEELSNVDTTRKEMEEMELDIQSLKHSSTATAQNSLMKMYGLIAAGVAIVAGIIVLLVVIF